MTKISVVIPLYNKASFVVDTLESVMKQSKPADEVLVIDDGSTDGGGSIVEAGFPSARVIRQSNQGEGPARNRGLLEARNSWVALLDADDIWMPNHLAELHRLAQRFPDCVLLGSRYRTVAGSRSRVIRAPWPADARRINYLHQAARNQGILCSSSVAVRREVLIQLGGFGPEKAGADLKTWLSLALNGPVALGGRVTCDYMADRGVTAEFESLRASKCQHLAAPAVRRPVQPAKLAALSPALGLAEEYLTQEVDLDVRNDLVVYINGRLWQAVRGAIRRGDDPRPLAAALRKPLGLRGVLARVVSALPSSAHQLVVKVVLVGRAFIRRLVSLRRTS